MNIKIKSIALVVFALFIVASCSDDSKESGGSFPDSIQGVWQEEGWDDGDEIGVYFTSSKIGYWDYMGDEYDEGEDCYWVEELGELVSRDGDNYRLRVTSEWADETETSEGVVKISVDGDMLTMTEPGDDSYEDIYSKDSRSVSGLTPVCPDQFAKANPKTVKIQKLLK